jgi:hypothetical protein
MGKFFVGCKRNDIDNEAGSSIDNEASSSRKTLYKNAENTVQKYRLLDSHILMLMEKRSQCLLHVIILAADRMKPNELKRHLETVHAECVGKTPEISVENSEFNRQKQAFTKITTVT